MIATIINVDDWFPEAIINTITSLLSSLILISLLVVMVGSPRPDSPMVAMWWTFPLAAWLLFTTILTVSVEET